MKPILVTGTAGFIGYHVAEHLLAQGKTVIGFDNINDYYDPALKNSRLERLARHDQFRFFKGDLVAKSAVDGLFSEFSPEYVVHLAAQAGVRYSLVNPQVYIDSNITGFVNILEACRSYSTSHLVYASTSSVYGANRKLPFAVSDRVDHPVSLYAASKKANELLAHSYSHLFGIPCTGLRFFTVYGPWGRPDMAMFLFAKAMLEGKPIDVYNFGKMRRDFTFIDDIVQGVTKVLFKIPEASVRSASHDSDPSTSHAPYRVYNIGNNESVELMRVIELLEQELGVTAVKNLLPIQPGDVAATFADIGAIQAAVGYEPTTSIEAGIKEFVVWYKDYFKVGRLGGS